VKARVLPHEEWHRLPEYMDPVLATMRPSQSRVCVVEDEAGAIVGRATIYPVWFVEDLWVDPAHRRQIRVGRRLWRLIKRALRELGVQTVASTFSDSPEVPALVVRQSLQAEVLPPMVAWTVKELETWR